jgi:hypothetical protein
LDLLLDTTGSSTPPKIVDQAEQLNEGGGSDPTTAAEEELPEQVLPDEVAETIKEAVKSAKEEGQSILQTHDEKLAEVEEKSRAKHSKNRQSLLNQLEKLIAQAQTH